MISWGPSLVSLVLCNIDEDLGWYGSGDAVTPNIFVVVGTIVFCCNLASRI